MCLTQFSALRAENCGHGTDVGDTWPAWPLESAGFAQRWATQQKYVVMIENCMYIFISAIMCHVLGISTLEMF